MRANRTVMAMLLGSAAIAGCSGSSNQPADNQVRETIAESGFILEGYPTDVADSIDLHNRQMAEAAAAVADGNQAMSSVMRERQYRWEPGGIVRVAFRGGTPALYAQIEAVAQRWTQQGPANVTLSFRDEAGRFRQWSPQDHDYAGEIRIGFIVGPSGGYWSLVGLDSIDPTIIGGRAGQQSMNFGGFDTALPRNWEGTVLHEFGHALGFEHEHQSPASSCGFRFDDDPGYVQTRDRLGQFVNDAQRRRPGLYTLLSGPPNRWNRAKVDRNLRQLAPSSALVTGPYDRLSIMEYFFYPTMFVSGTQSPCYLTHENNVLSAQDKVAVAEAYPSNAAAVGRLATRIEAETRALARAAPSDRALGASLDARADYRAAN